MRRSSPCWLGHVDLQQVGGTSVPRPKAVCQRLGHASIDIALDTYSHVMPGMQEEAAEKIDAGLRKALAG